REELALIFGVPAARAPLDLEGVADLQAGEADDELLVLVVGQEVGADVAHLDVARLDLDDGAVGLVDTGQVQGDLLVGGVVDDVAVLAQALDAGTAVDPRDLVGGGLGGAVGLDAVGAAGVEDAGGGVFEVVPGDSLPDGGIVMVGGRLPRGPAR